MSNKEKLNEAIEQDINMKDYYNEIIRKIEADVGVKIKSKEISYTKKYDGSSVWSPISIEVKAFLSTKLKKLGNGAEKYLDDFAVVKNEGEFNQVISKAKSNNETSEILNLLETLRVYYKNTWSWDNPIEEYVTRVYLKSNLPKFMYYDDYYMLPSRISIENLKNNKCTENFEKTGKALLELADIDIDKLTTADNFEDYKAELEATQLIISEELFKRLINCL